MAYLQEDDILEIARITEKEKDTYYRVSKSRSVLKGMYDTVFETMWETS